MTPREVNLLLTKAAALDPRVGSLLRDGGAVLVAQEWHAVIGGLGFEDALAAMRDHYSQAGARALLPGDLLERVAPARLTSDDLARERWLTARGLSEEDVRSMPMEELAALVNGEEVRGVGA